MAIREQISEVLCAKGTYSRVNEVLFPVEGIFTDPKTGSLNDGHDASLLSWRDFALKFAETI